MTIEPTRDFKVMESIFRNPEVSDEFGGLPEGWNISIIDKPESVYLLVRLNDGTPAGLIWGDWQDVGLTWHIMATRKIRGRMALKAIKGAINWVFLHGGEELTEIYAKAPFRKSYFLMKMLGWEDVKTVQENWGGRWGVVTRRIVKLTRKKWLANSAFPPFFVTGYPRSGTAWAANLLTHNGAYCLHEGSVYGGGMEAWICGGKNRGVSEATITLTSTILQDSLDSRVVWIKRDKESASKAFKKWSVENGVLRPDQMPNVDILFDRLEKSFDLILTKHPGVLVIDFKDLFTVESAEKIWRWCLPGLDFDRTRAQILCGMNVQQSPRGILDVRNNPVLPETEQGGTQLPLLRSRRACATGTSPGARIRVP